MAYRRAILRQAQDLAGGGSPFAAQDPGPAPFRLPCSDQTSESIAGWLGRHAAPGMVVVVRHARWHLYEYHLDEITRANPQGGRVHLARHGAFDLAGSAISAPKNVLTLLEPTPAVLDAAIAGRTWQHGRSAFKRPLGEREVELARQLRLEDAAPRAAEAV